MAFRSYLPATAPKEIKDMEASLFRTIKKNKP
jgi:hypothetical protein